MNATQLELFPLQAVDYTPDLTLAERFDLWHAANPHVADALERLAEQWFAAGNQRIGVKALFERLRWEAGVRTVASDGYVLNNNWTAFYGRLLVERHPEWKDRISLRQQRAAA
jgi:hypothetical protein